MPFNEAEPLTLLSHAPADEVKQFVEEILPSLGHIRVMQNRTGLVMLPYTDTVQGVVFHLGEVLMAEARVQLDEEYEGYGACLGRDLQQALAIAILDAARQAGQQLEATQNFLNRQAKQQAAADDTLLRKVEATRVEMETF